VVGHGVWKTALPELDEDRSSTAASVQQRSEPGTVVFVSLGDTLDVEEGHTYFVGEFHGAFVASGEPGLFQHSAVECAGFVDSSRVAGGYCVFTIGTGDTATTEWRCSNATTPQDSVPAGACEAAWISGTGGLEGIAGSMSFQVLILPTYPDGSFSGVAILNDGLVYSLPND
jgi:hypothetical protein